MASQTNQINIGDRFPQIAYDYLVTSGVTTEDLEGKLLIFDFGTSYCAPCMASLINMESLSGTYGNEVKFFMVTSESKERLKGRLQSKNGVVILKEDTLLHQLFPHKTQPHVVWVDKEGSVLTYTDHHGLAKAHIDAALYGENLDYPIKWDFPYDYGRNLTEYLDNFKKVSPRLPEKVISGAVSKHLPGVSWKSGEEVDSVQQTRRVWAINMPLGKLLPLIFGSRLGVDFFLSQFELSDSVDLSSLIYNNDRRDFPEWRLKNTFSYDFKFPLAMDSSKTADVLLSQLSAITGLEVVYEKRPREVIIVRQTGATERNNSTEGVNRVSLHALQFAYNGYGTELPMIIDLPEKERFKRFVLLNEEAYRDREQLQKQLEPQGYVLEVQVREIPTIIIER